MIEYPIYKFLLTVRLFLRYGEIPNQFEMNCTMNQNLLPCGRLKSIFSKFKG